MRSTVLTLLIIAFSTLIPTALAKQPAPPSNTSGTLEGQVVAPSAATFPSAPNKPTPAPAPKPAARSAADMQPVRVSIPSIGLNDPIERMGVLSNGELNVPNGSTNNVGWYAAGTRPGQVGSAVLDAHVFAAFSNLKYVKPGDSIYITDADGTVLHFVVQTSEVFKLANLTSTYLFSRDDARRLTLITCAGHLTPDHSTYDHRLVVSAVLAQ